MSEKPETIKESSIAPRGLHIPDAAKYMGLSPWSVELIVRSRELPALKLSRHYTILREDCDAFLDRQKAAVKA